MASAAVPGSLALLQSVGMLPERFAAYTKVSGRRWCKYRRRRVLHVARGLEVRHVALCPVITARFLGPHHTGTSTRRGEAENDYPVENITDT
jgi:hypothetical protein